jgi:hypothetical protein
MTEKDDIIRFVGESGESIEFRVLEQTRLNGKNYLLVLDAMEGEEDEALILREIPTESKDENTYEIVDDDEELKAIGSVFENMLDDIKLV